MNRLKLILPFIILSIIGNLHAQSQNQLNKRNQIHLNKNEYLSITFNIFGAAYFEGGSKISKRKFIENIKTKPGPYQHFKFGQKLNTAGNLIGIPAGFILGWHLSKRANNKKQVINPLLAASGFGVAMSILMGELARTRKRKAIDLYNFSNFKQTSLNIDENGIGIAIHF